MRNPESRKSYFLGLFGGIFTGALFIGVAAAALDFISDTESILNELKKPPKVSTTPYAPTSTLATSAISSAFPTLGYSPRPSASPTAEVSPSTAPTPTTSPSHATATKSTTTQSPRPSTTLSPRSSETISGVSYVGVSSDHGLVYIDSSDKSRKYNTEFSITCNDATAIVSAVRFVVVDGSGKLSKQSGPKPYDRLAPDFCTNDQISVTLQKDPASLAPELLATIS